MQPLSQQREAKLLSVAIMVSNEHFEEVDETKEIRLYAVNGNNNSIFLNL